MPNFRGDVKTSERKSHDKSLGVNIFAGVGRLGCGWLEPTDGKWYFRLVHFSDNGVGENDAGESDWPVWPGIDPPL